MRLTLATLIPALSLSALADSPACPGKHPFTFHVGQSRFEHARLPTVTELASHGGKWSLIGIAPRQEGLFGRVTDFNINGIENWDGSKPYLQFYAKDDPHPEIQAVVGGWYHRHSHILFRQGFWGREATTSPLFNNAHLFTTDTGYGIWKEVLVTDFYMYSHGGPLNAQGLHVGGLFCDGDGPVPINPKMFESPPEDARTDVPEQYDLKPYDPTTDFNLLYDPATDTHIVGREDYDSVAGIFKPEPGPSFKRPSRFAVQGRLFSGRFLVLQLTFYAHPADYDDIYYRESVAEEHSLYVPPQQLFKSIVDEHDKVVFYLLFEKRDTI